jgi:competence protein ComEC
MIQCLNNYIERLDLVPFATWKGLYITLPQALLLTAFILTGYFWMLRKQRPYLFTALVCLLGFICIRTYSFIYAGHQKQLIVYNIPHHQMIDIIDGRSCSFIGDAITSSEYNSDFIFHVQPSRMLHRIAQTNSLNKKDFMFSRQMIFVIDSSIHFTTSTFKPVVDLVVLSKNPKLYIDNLSDAFAVKQIVIDASVPSWKAQLWKRDCDSLHIPCWNVAEKGAYIKKY